MVIFHSFLYVYQRVLYVWHGDVGLIKSGIRLRRVLGPGQRLHRGEGQWGAFRAAQRPPNGAWLGGKLIEMGCEQKIGDGSWWENKSKSNPQSLASKVLGWKGHWCWCCTRNRNQWDEMLLQTSLGRSKLDPGPQLFGETPDGSEWQSLQKPGASENWLCLKIDENCVYIMIHGLFFPEDDDKPLDLVVTTRFSDKPNWVNVHRECPTLMDFYSISMGMWGSNFRDNPKRVSQGTRHVAEILWYTHLVSSGERFQHHQANGFNCCNML